MTPDDFVYTLAQRVLLRDPNIEGVIQAILFNTDGIQYQVAYWDDSIRRVEWCFEWEIQSIQKTQKVAT